MKIFHLVGNKAWGGGEQYVYDIADSLQREGNFPPEIVCKDIDCLNQNFSRLKDTRITHLPLSGYFDLRSILALANAIKKEGKCIIHAHDFKRAFIALAARKLSHNKEAKVIMTRHLVRKAKKSIIERFIYRNIDKIIFVSNLAKDAFLSTFPEIDLTKCLVIHNGVKDHSNSNAKELRKEYSIPDDEMILMYHGRITHEKGVEVIIKALGKLPDDIRCRLFIIGSGDNDYITRLKAEAQASNIANKIEWIGFQSDVIPWIKGTDCGIIPTIAQESFGLSVAEYMMAGKAVITTNNGAQKEFIKDKETGLLIPPDDAEALTRSITYVYNNSYGKEIGRQALAYYKDNLSFDIFYAKLKKIYEE